MDEKEIRKIVSIFKKSPFLSEMDLSDAGKRIRLKRSAVIGSVRADHSVIQGKTSSEKDPAAPIPEEARENLLKIESPLIGTFYRAPSPKAKPFVETGETVQKGRVVCIIEAMKLMNEIESEAEGKIVEILPQNGKLVECGETLFLLEPWKQPER